MNIWQKLMTKKRKGPFFCLAPMVDVTDTAFRQVIAKYSRHGKPGGGPDVFWTEFTSADGIASDLGRKKVLRLLKYSKKEKPIIAQVFGSKPENITKACKIISKMGFDGVDINMGCPVRDIVSQGSCSALIKTPSLAREIIRAAKRGAPLLPISVKTRIGYTSPEEYKTWLPEILSEDISALTIHLRTRKEMSSVPAHWELAKDIVKVARSVKKDIVLIANGDIETLQDGNGKAIESGFDGVMIGRGIFGNPWLFDTKRKNLPTTEEKLKVLIEHTKLFEKLIDYRNFSVMKKHFKAYVNGFEGAKELRVELMATNNSKEVVKIINSFTKVN
jgi:nifR3 family TIM-barrel protein